MTWSIEGGAGPIDGHDEVDNEGMPAGGFATANGISIQWQKGPLAVDGVRLEPNGAFVEDLLRIFLKRMAFYQEGAGGRFRCHENAMAIMKAEEALDWLERRTRDREARGVEGTHQP